MLAPTDPPRPVTHCLPPPPPPSSRRANSDLRTSMAATRGRPVEALMQPRHMTGSLPTKRRRTDRRRELSAWKNAAARKSVGARFEAPLVPTSERTSGKISKPVSCGEYLACGRLCDFHVLCYVSYFTIENCWTTLV